MIQRPFYFFLLLSLICPLDIQWNYQVGRPWLEKNSIETLTPRCDCQGRKKERWVEGKEGGRKKEKDIFFHCSKQFLNFDFDAF